MAYRPSHPRLSRLPKVDRILADPALAPYAGFPVATETVRALLQEAREQVISGNATVPDAQQLALSARQKLERRFAPRLRRVINGTGILIHTNLGRAPLSETAIDAVVEVARGYSTLEYDLTAGKRGSRHYLVHELLTTLSGAEDALVVNNNAAALLLALATLAKRKEVVVSRGQLVEIGGSFRIPDICRASGAKLVEVGTTNRTRLSDYKAAIGDRTGALLRVHPSNFRISGFTEEVALTALIQLGDEHSLPLIDDLGSGALVELSSVAAAKGEPLVSQSVAAGAAVVTFSGDKLLGGPQAGIAVGKREYIARMRSNPLMRAVRPDKMTFAALDATLRHYLAPASLHETVPLHRMLTESLPSLEKWGEVLVAEMTAIAGKSGVAVDLAHTISYTGGGSLPEEALPSVSLRFTGKPRQLISLQSRLRLGDPPVIGYLKEEAFYLDLRTMRIENQDTVLLTLRQAFAATTGGDT